MRTTPHPEVSPDGRFYWDGERWVPVALMDEEGFARHKGHGLRNVLLGCLGLIVLLVFIGIYSSLASHQG